jgi:hypothetical protein
MTETKITSASGYSNVELAEAFNVPFDQVVPTERRRNRTFQPWGCQGLPVLKTGWATRPLPLRARAYARG